MRPLFKFLCVLMAMSLPFFASAEDMVIGAEDDAAPWSYKNGTGFANDIVQNSFKAAGVNVTFNVVPYARCKYLAEKGQVLACFTTSKNADTLEHFLFPKNYLINVHNVLWTRETSGLKGCDPKKWNAPPRVLSINEYEYVEKFNDYVKNGIIFTSKVNSETQGLHMLERHRSDAVIINIDEVKTIKYVMAQAKINSKFTMACDLGAMKGYLAFSKKNPGAPSALAKFDKGYEIIKKNGTLKTLQTKWAEKAMVMRLSETQKN